MTLLFREAALGDIPALVAMLADDDLGRSREVVTDPPAPCYQAALEAIARPPNDSIIVADLDGVVVGCAQLTFFHGLSRQGMTRAQIEGVRIAASHRGARIGEALINALVERARKAGCGLVQLTTDKSRERAQAFYERLGFVPSHVGMKKPL